MIRNSTISGNSSGTGAGGVNNGINPAQTVEIENSIVAGNSGPPGKANCYRAGAGPIDSKGHNIEDSNTCPFSATGDRLNTNPLLNPLASNGGPTQTMALQRSSPAIRAANAAVCPATDQRGVTRADGCDIGAFQFEDITSPALSKLKLSPRSFAARSSGGSVITRRRARRGTKVRFTLSEAAGVKFTVERRIKGRRQGRKCKAKRRHGKRCTIVRALRGSFDAQGKQGANTVKFSGRLNGKKLKPGVYQLVATPTDAAANTGKAVRAQFKIVR